eukprot:6207577-Pleurochrysis_carterae.AAC.1
MNKQPTPPNPPTLQQSFCLLVQGTHALSDFPTAPLFALSDFPPRPIAAKREGRGRRARGEGRAANAQQGHAAT